MLKKSYIFCFVSLGFIFLFTYFAGYYYGKSNKNIKSFPADNKIQIQQETSKKRTDKNNDTQLKKDGFIVTIKNNHVVIYNKNNEFISNTEIDISTIDPREIDSLKEGIYIDNAKGLFYYLESLTS